jgi:hypothetical protein
MNFDAGRTGLCFVVFFIGQGAMLRRCLLWLFIIENVNRPPLRWMMCKERAMERVMLSDDDDNVSVTLCCELGKWRWSPEWDKAVPNALGIANQPHVLSKDIIDTKHDCSAQGVAGAFWEMHELWKKECWKWKFVWRSAWYARLPEVGCSAECRKRDWEKHSMACIKEDEQRVTDEIPE